ncbi:MAG: YibE/F family protein [Spirochaetales bacterium]|nr:YibE/F family protein [Spirochaetales bacterium]
MSPINSIKSLPKLLRRPPVTGALIIALTALLITIAYNLPYTPYSTGMSGAVLNYEIARITEIEKERVSPSKQQETLLVGSQDLLVELLTGSHRGEVVEAKNKLTPYNSVLGKTGRFLIVIVDEITVGKQKGRFSVRVFNYFRAPFIYLLGLLFFGSLIVVGRRKGLMSGIGLLYTFLCVLTIFLPLVLRGYSPILAAILLVIVVSTVSLILLNGVSRKSLCCILGTVSGVVLSGLILKLFGTLIHISGFNTNDTETLLLISQKTGLKVRDILYSGILIASLGAIMDIAMSVVSSMNEVKNHRPDSSPSALFKAGMNVGKDVIGTMSNTLILVFTGTSLNLLIIISSFSVQYNQFTNMNRTAIEITQALSGSLALVLTVPITAFITSRLLKEKNRKNK